VFQKLIAKAGSYEHCSKIHYGMLWQCYEKVMTSLILSSLLAVAAAAIPNKQNVSRISTDWQQI